MTSDLTRRQFMGAGALALAAARLDLNTLEARALPRNTTILFQGDSVTDNFHVRTIADANSERALGTGYPLLVAAEVLKEAPANGIRFFNRGVSGNKIPDLEARWQTDTLDLKPDLLSVLIGVNDFWHTLLNGYTGTVETYEKGYLALLQNTRTALPHLKLVVMEPFALEGKFVDARWYPTFPAYQAAAHRVARATGAVFVPLQEVFAKQAKKYGAALWTHDGVHPTAAGHALIAKQWRHVTGV